MPIVRAVALLASLAIARLAAAQGPATGVVVGRAATVAGNDSIALRGAVVAISGAPHEATTAADGSYLIADVPAGMRMLRVRRTGYRNAERVIDVIAGDTVRVVVLLQPDTQRLAPVATVARSPDAEAFATRPNVATISLGKAAMAGVPSAGEPDVIRTAQLLPGVEARNDYNTGLNVRGGEADQNLVLLDGYPIYNPFHLGGLFSTFMDATVGSIDLVTGAFPSRYGGRLSSVIDVRSAEETRPGVHASADISALGATGRFAGAFDDGRGTWSIAGRRTYADALASAFTNNIFPYHFHDFEAHVAYSLSHRTRLTLTAYEGRDVLDANLAEFSSDSGSKAGAGQWAFNWGNRMLGASITRELGADSATTGRRLTLEQRVSLSSFSTLLDLGEGAFSQESRVNDVTIAGSVTSRGETHDASIGYELATQRIRYASGSTETGTSDFDIVQHPASAALWVDDLWRISPRWIVEGGLRGEALRERHWAALSPSVSAKYFITPELALTAAAARVTQSQHSLSGDGPLRYFEVWIASDSVIPVATAWHWIAGAERRMGNTKTVRVEGFLKRYDKLLEANPSEDPGVHGDEFLPTEGTSYGFDLSARLQPARGLAGWVSYTYGVSSRRRDGAQWAPGHDRRHDLNVVATWPVAKYRLGARLGYASGTPFTPIVGEIARRTYDPSRDRWGTGEPQRYLESLGGARNSARFPPTTRVDLDASREFAIRSARVRPYISILNTFNAQNVMVYLYKYSISPPTRRAISQFPILPSAGVRIEF
ncbi:MAG: TonB-dependent receptor domain-containing protein [Gemmatimonadaceae bacterium]